jgi:hypothetical protein
MFYYSIVGSGVYDSVDDLPMPLKTSGESVSCGSQDAVSVYKKAIGEDDSDDSGGDTGGSTGGICCALKISGKEDFQGDFESTTTKTCSEIWKVGRTV